MKIEGGVKKSGSQNVQKKRLYSFCSRGRPNKGEGPFQDESGYLKKRKKPDRKERKIYRSTRSKEIAKSRDQSASPLGTARESITVGKAGIDRGKAQKGVKKKKYGGRS